MAKKRDFQSDLDQLSLRREYLRNNIPLPPNLIINATADDHSTTKVVKRRSTPKEFSDSTGEAPPIPVEGGSGSSKPPNVLATADNINSKSSPLSRSPSREGSQKASPKPLTPSRIHSNEFPLEIHDELSDIIGQLNINRLTRRNVNEEQGCLQTLTAVLENGHAFMQSSQMSTILPAHIEILLEVISRAHTDGLPMLLNRGCRMIQSVLTTNSLTPASLAVLAEPLGTVANTNALVILALETDMHNECLNILEAVAKARSRNLKGHLQRLCGIGTKFDVYFDDNVTLMLLLFCSV